jgi:hypothetical protein
MVAMLSTVSVGLNIVYDCFPRQQRLISRHWSCLATTSILLVVSVRTVRERGLPGRWYAVG